MKLTISTTRRENLLGLSYLLFSMFVLPTVLALASLYLAIPMSETVINLIYFAVNFLAVAVIFHKFLAASVKAALQASRRCIWFAAVGLILYFVMTMLISRIILMIDPEFANVNDQSIAQMAEKHYALMVFFTVLLVPITEETLYRGLLFQTLQRKNRFVAYILSVFVFSMIHIIGYIGMFDFCTLALCFAQYLPAGIALAWAYEKSYTILTPILIHIIINLIGFAALR